jgi:ParB family chromosome partitioning protein
MARRSGAAVAEQPQEAQETIPRGIGTLEVLYISIEEIGASVLNPRREFNPEKLLTLSESLLAHGMLQPITLRPVTSREILREDAPAGAKFGIVAGERRYRAAQIAKLTHVPCIVHEMDDATHLEIAITENLERQDISDIELAEAFARLQKEGRTQAAIGKRFGLAQNTVAGVLGLLRLPEMVRDLIHSGQLSRAHGKALARFAKWPAVCEVFAKWAVAQNATSKALEGEICWPMRDAALKAGAVRDLGYGCHFDTAVCNGCPFGARLVWEGHHYCAKPEHFEELTESHKAKLKEQAREYAPQNAEALEHVREKGSPSAQEALQDVSCQGGLTLSSLPSGSYEVLPWNIPTACTAGCPCRVKLPAWDGELYDVCLDPKRMQSLKVRETKAAKADAKTRYKQSLERLRGRLATDVTNEAELSRLIAPLVWSTVQSVSAAVRRQIASEAPPALATVLCEGNLSHSGRTQAFELLSKADYHDLLRAALLILAASEHAAQLEMSSRFQESAALEWYLSRPSVPRAAASAPPDGDTPTAYLIGGVTLDPEDYRCVACGAVVRDAVFADPLAVWLTISLQGGSVIQKAEDGAMLMPNGAVYCPECAEGLQYCQYCGCTEEAACPGGCSWVAPGVCSVCAGW